MKDAPPFGLVDLFCLLLVLGVAGGLRVGYLALATDYGSSAPTLLVQGPVGPERESQQRLALRVHETGRFETRAPFAEKEEPTAHRAPGYPWLLGQIPLFTAEPDVLARWLQCVLGTLTAGCYFFFARRAFDSLLVGTLAGLLTAVHPFWIINTAELADGTLVSFLLAASLAMGTRASAAGGPFTSLVFGLLLAGLAMVRAALLPFTLIALLGFLWRCRLFRWGWFAGLLAFLGYANGLAPWTVRNWQVFGEPLPIASSTYLHLWIGNHADANGALPDEEKLRAALPPDILKELLEEPNQARRYARLGLEAWKEVSNEPDQAVGRRLNAGLVFLLGEIWLRERRFAATLSGPEPPPAPTWIDESAELFLACSMVVMLVLAFFGWRWSVEWACSTRLATRAVLFIPLPYVLSHAESLSGPRLPLDGVLLCYGAFALAYVLTGHASAAEPEPAPVEA